MSFLTNETYSGRTKHRLWTEKKDKGHSKMKLLISLIFLLFSLTGLNGLKSESNGRWFDSMVVYQIIPEKFVVPGENESILQGKNTTLSNKRVRGEKFFFDRSIRIINKEPFFMSMSRSYNP